MALLALAVSPLGVAAQRPDSVKVGQRIQDNSFFVEEAYNQEPGVVQHIGSFVRANDGGAIFFFTQEWPYRGMQHQLSYTIPMVHGARGSADGTGLGDIALNYRYQLVGRSPEAALLMAPRVSLLLPTGSRERGRGNGGLGVQVNLPLTWVPLPRLATHWNAGVTIVPRARFPGAPGATTVGWNVGASAIYLASDRINFMLEGVRISNQIVGLDGSTSRGAITILSPGVRGAFDFASGLQIVPGAAYAIGMGRDQADAVLVYLSFEHPFRH